MITSDSEFSDIEPSPKRLGIRSKSSDASLATAKIFLNSMQNVFCEFRTAFEHMESLHQSFHQLDEGIFDDIFKHPRSRIVLKSKFESMISIVSTMKKFMVNIETFTSEQLKLNETEKNRAPTQFSNTLKLTQNIANRESFLTMMSSKNNDEEYKYLWNDEFRIDEDRQNTLYESPSIDIAEINSTKVVSPVNCVAYENNGIYAGCEDGHLRVFSKVSLYQEHAFKAHKGQIWCLAITNNTLTEDVLVTT